MWSDLNGRFRWSTWHDNSLIQHSTDRDRITRTQFLPCARFDVTSRWSLDHNFVSTSGINTTVKKIVPRVFSFCCSALKDWGKSKPQSPQEPLCRLNVMNYLSELLLYFCFQLKIIFYTSAEPHTIATLANVGSVKNSWFFFSKRLQSLIWQREKEMLIRMCDILTGHYQGLTERFVCYNLILIKACQLKYCTCVSKKKKKEKNILGLYLHFEHCPKTGR